jgi:hypothetical protein
MFKKAMSEIDFYGKGKKDYRVQMNDIRMILDLFYYPGKMKILNLKFNKKMQI